MIFTIDDEIINLDNVKKVRISSKDKSCLSFDDTDVWISNYEDIKCFVFMLIKERLKEKKSLELDSVYLEDIYNLVEDFGFSVEDSKNTISNSYTSRNLMSLLKMKITFHFRIVDILIENSGLFHNAVISRFSLKKDNLLHFLRAFNNLLEDGFFVSGTVDDLQSIIEKYRNDKDYAMLDNTTRSYVVDIYKKDNECYSLCFDFDGCFSTGNTIEEAIDNYRKALDLHIKGLREGGLSIPIPSSIEYIKEHSEDNPDYRVVIDVDVKE